MIVALGVMSAVAGAGYCATAWFRKRRARQSLARVFAQPADSFVSQKSIVAAYHPRAREIGEEILASGGNAFDAFVAVAAAENVLAEGASSFAGPLAVLLYPKRNGRVRFLDANFNDPVDPKWRRRARMKKDGRAVLVPGAPAGLEAIAREYGRRSFGELLAPAIRLARDGFPVARVMSHLIAFRTDVLKQGAYGNETFFDERGEPLRPGAILRQPEVATFLEALATEGGSYVYSGEWGDRFLREVWAHKGILSQKDLQGYRVLEEDPWSCIYRGRRVQSCPGYGGLWTLLALKTLEHTELPKSVHFSADGKLLELLLRITREVWKESWIFNGEIGKERAFVSDRLTPEYTSTIWERVLRKMNGDPGSSPGSHSYHISVVDQEGNIASGTITVEDEPWGEGIFVQGIPLSTAGTIPWSTAPGKRRLNPFSTHFVFEENRLRYIVGGISNSVVETAFQFLVNLIDYNLPVEQAVSLPRFGTFPSTKKHVYPDRNWLDPRVSPAIVKYLNSQGLRVQNTGVVDTGLGNVVALNENEEHTSANAAVPYLPLPFEIRPQKVE
jgi:gamma-glutamyltranspeptidase/glutathione hydrolase